MSSSQPGQLLVLAASPGASRSGGTDSGRSAPPRRRGSAVQTLSAPRPVSTSSLVIARCGQRVDARGVAQGDEVDPADAARRGRWWCRTRRRPRGACRRARRRARSGTGRRRRGWRRPWRCPRSRRCPSGRRRCRCRRAPATGLEEVTNGYVPWSMSSSVRLRALEEDVAAAVEHVPREPRGVGDVLLDPVAVGEVVLGHRLQVELGRLGERAQLTGAWAPSRRRSSS